MNLVVDIGNTATKLATFHGNELIDREVIDEINRTEIEDFVSAKQIEGMIVCAVGYFPPKLMEIDIKQKIFLDKETSLPIENQYKSKDSLGYDRIASVIGANNLIKNRAILCVDTGTCITYDLLDRNNNYKGGAISPGIDLRLLSLHTFTENLPLVELNKKEKIELIGGNTKESILSGVYFGIIEEFNGIISRYREKYPDLAVVLTGGNAELFESNMKSEIFAFPDSVLHGLNAILEYNTIKK